ncbi:MAG: hypothetical protein JWM93_2516 [Frankiales bacterium]|nr:hypothetical protein [Frankiales bacterium]
MPDVSEGNTIPDPSEMPETADPAADAPTREGGPSRGPMHVETAYARGVGSSSDVDGTHHDATPPGEGEGTGIGESGG